MNREQKKELRQRQSTRQLMGIVRVTPHGIVTDSGERVFFLIQPDNLSVLSPEVIRGRVRSLTMLLSTQPTLEILALDSRESFQRNKEYYLRRLEEETEPAVRDSSSLSIPISRYNQLRRVAYLCAEGCDASDAGWSSLLQFYC